MHEYAWKVQRDSSGADLCSTICDPIFTSDRNKRKLSVDIASPHEAARARLRLHMHDAGMDAPTGRDPTNSHANCFEMLSQIQCVKCAAIRIGNKCVGAVRRLNLSIAS